MSDAGNGDRPGGRAWRARACQVNAATRRDMAAAQRMASRLPSRRAAAAARSASTGSASLASVSTASRRRGSGVGSGPVNPSCAMLCSSLRAPQRTHQSDVLAQGLVRYKQTYVIHNVKSPFAGKRQHR